MQNQTLAFTVDGMTCGHCVRAVKELIEEVEGVSNVSVSLEDKQAVVSFSEKSLAPESIVNHINSNSNYKAKLK
jgi:copper ion binding protein